MSMYNPDLRSHDRCVGHRLMPYALADSSATPMRYTRPSPGRVAVVAGTKRIASTVE